MTDVPPTELEDEQAAAKGDDTLPGSVQADDEAAFEAVTADEARATQGDDDA
jgi:hypothetical protein